MVRHAATQKKKKQFSKKIKMKNKNQPRANEKQKATINNLWQLMVTGSDLEQSPHPSHNLREKEAILLVNN